MNKLILTLLGLLLSTNTQLETVNDKSIGNVPLGVLAEKECRGVKAFPPFIEEWKEVAIREMGRTGIPASIKMAQAIVESGWGDARIAKEANNFFGIKCGRKPCREPLWLKDDEPGLSRFRRYECSYESWEDHSEVLKLKRYEPCYDCGDNYMCWAYCIRAKGYATDFFYGEKLIKVIESDSLYLLDEILRKRGRGFY